MLWLAVGPKLSEIHFNSSILRACHIMKVLSGQIREPLQTACQVKFHRDTFFPQILFSHVYMLYHFSSCWERGQCWLMQSYSRTDCTWAVRAHHSLFSLQTTPRHLGKCSVVSLQQQVGLAYLIRILHAPHCHLCRNSHDAGMIAYRLKKAGGVAVMNWWCLTGYCSCWFQSLMSINRVTENRWTVYHMCEL